MRFPCKYLMQRFTSAIFYGVFWKNSRARRSASASLAAHTVTMATLPMISISNGTAPLNAKSCGTGTRTTNCSRRLILFMICSMVFIVPAPVSSCYTCFFNTTADHGPDVRSHQAKHCTVYKPFKFNHSTRPITAYINESIRCSYACPCLRK
jgi:hypothetical protein